MRLSLHIFLRKDWETPSEGSLTSETWPSHGSEQMPNLSLPTTRKVLRKTPLGLALATASALRILMLAWLTVSYPL